MSMRLEKNWGVWTLDFRPDFTAGESGLDAFVASMTAVPGLEQTFFALTAKADQQPDSTLKEAS